MASDTRRIADVGCRGWQFIVPGSQPDTEGVKARYVLDSHFARPARWLGCPVGLMLTCAVAGCGSGVGQAGPTGETVDGNRDGSLTSTLGATSGEPDNAFTEATAAILDGEYITRLQGTITNVGDMDVFLLGAFSAGDRLVVDVDATSSLLDASVAIFDAERKLVYNNDDRGGSGARVLDPYIDWVTRHPGESYFLVVTHSAFAPNGRYTGSYKVDVQIGTGFAIPEPAGQILLLDFDGGLVSSSHLMGL